MDTLSRLIKWRLDIASYTHLARKTLFPSLKKLIFLACKNRITGLIFFSEQSQYIISSGGVVKIHEELLVFFSMVF